MNATLLSDASAVLKGKRGVGRNGRRTLRWIRQSKLTSCAYFAAHLNVGQVKRLVVCRAACPKDTSGEGSRE